MGKITAAKFNRKFELNSRREIVGRLTPLPIQERKPVKFATLGDKELTVLVSPGQIINPRKELKRQTGLDADADGRFGMSTKIIKE